MTAALPPLLLSIALIALGRWGLRDPDALVPTTLSPERRARDVRSLRRGARSVIAAGLVLAAFALAVLALAAVRLAG